MKPVFAVRMPRDRRAYEVYEVRTGGVVKEFRYGRTEVSRVVAHGRANLLRDRMNRETREGLR